MNDSRRGKGLKASGEGAESHITIVSWQQRQMEKGWKTWVSKKAVLFTEPGFSQRRETLT